MFCAEDSDGFALGSLQGTAPFVGEFQPLDGSADASWQEEWADHWRVKFWDGEVPALFHGLKRKAVNMAIKRWFPRRMGEQYQLCVQAICDRVRDARFHQPELSPMEKHSCKFESNILI